MRSNYIIVRYHTVLLACGYANAHLRITYYPKISDKILYYYYVKHRLCSDEVPKTILCVYTYMRKCFSLSKRVEKQAAKYLSILIQLSTYLKNERSTVTTVLVSMGLRHGWVSAKRDCQIGLSYRIP